MADKPITVDDVRKALREGLKPVTPPPVAPEAEQIITVDDVRRFLKGNQPEALTKTPEPVKQPEKAPPVRSNGDPDAKPTMNPKAKPTHTGKKAR